MANRLCVYLVFHQDLPEVYSPVCRPIEAGASQGGQDDKTLKDNTGENISDKNDCYSEMTAQYWVWKNAGKFSELVGFCHYRRQFDQETISLAASLKAGEVITPRALKLSRSISRQYLASHWSLPWRVMMEVLEEKQAAYHATAKVLFSGNTLYPFNIFILERENFQAYMAWIFGLLFEIEKRIPPKALSDYQKRYMGFLSERLFTLYLVHNQFRIMEVPIMGSKTDLLTRQSLLHRWTVDMMYRLRRK
jgi:hypothetical protein